jgi:iron complex transport system ATP-binding protein
MLTGLIGPNGSGKSTLLQVAAGLLPAATGEVAWGGRSLAKIPLIERGQLTAWVPQDARFEFGFTVRSVVAQGRYAHGDDGAGVDAALVELDLSALASRPVTRLSGGECRRVLLARALATNASLQLWDEPLAPLDPRHALETLALARKLAQRTGAATLFSLHDLALAASLDRVVVMHEGRLLAHGTPENVFTPELLLKVFRVRSTLQLRPVMELP